MADEFNKFFVSASQTTDENIKSLANKFNIETGHNDNFIPREFPETNKFSALNAANCKHAVKDIITSLASNKAPGIDRIPIRVIKVSLGSILPVLTSVINTSIATNMSPTQWKLAEMTPIAKDTEYEQASNNRPISIRVGGFFLYTRYPKKCFIQIYRKLYGDALLVPTWMGNNMADGNQQKHLLPGFATKA